MMLDICLTSRYNYLTAIQTIHEFQKAIPTINVEISYLSVRPVEIEHRTYVVLKIYKRKEKKRKEKKRPF